MILLDTNVISALMLPSPVPEIVSWLDRQPQSSIWTTSITVAEITFGLQIRAHGKRRTSLMSEFEGVLQDMDYRVAGFDTDAAHRAAELMAVRHKAGRPRDWRDTMIAAIALAQRATLATRNTTHFEDAGIPLVDPWKP
jgi:predicted nucleic acid-binding protein